MCGIFAGVFLHVEESNSGAVELYSKEGYARADILDSAVRNMDKMLRLVLQVHLNYDTVG